MKTEKDRDCQTEAGRAEAAKTEKDRDCLTGAERAEAARTEKDRDCLTGAGRAETAKTGRGCVWLVGAGCGGPELLTLRGAELLGRCDAVVYDDLLDRGLLTLAPGAEQIYAGKRSGAHSVPQEEIQALLVRLAGEGKRVVRLKGGDPFVFGRGAEELEALRKAGIPCETVPGVTSAIGIPELAGIPVTCRGISQGVHIVTAHTAHTPDGLPADFDALAALDGTLVFLMGLRQLPRIVQRLISAGKSPDTPAAVLGSETVRGSLSELPALAEHVRPPAVIVAGPAAALELTSTIPDRRPLSGLRIGLTGTRAIQEKLSGPLKELGAKVFRPLTLELRPLPCTPDLTGAPWLVFTSGNGVRRFFQAMREEQRDLRELANCRFAVVGRATGETLWEYGFRADLIPETATTAALAGAIREHVTLGSRLLLLRSARAGGELAASLEGYAVEDHRIYDVSTRTGETPDLDYLVFASAGSVRACWERLGEPAAHCVCIGPVTAAALRERTAAPFLTAPEISAAGLLRAILDHHLS